MRLRLAVKVAVLSVSALGASAQESESPTVKELYQKARTEGKVVIWGSLKREVDWIQAALDRRFPGIKVDWTADQRSASRIIAEARAGRHAVDVFHFSLGGMLELNERGLLGRGVYAVFGTAPESVFFDGAAGATHNLVYAAVYNHDKVAKADLPKTWEGFLEPRWKGKLVASPFLLPRLLGFLALDWGEERAAQFGRALMQRQDVLLTRAPREGILASGERIVSITEFASAAYFYRKGGVPASYWTLETIPANQFAVAPLAHAPHPDAARFLAGWLTTQDAKDAREAYSSDADVRPGAQSKLAAELRQAGGKIVLETPENMAIRARYYQKLSSIVTGGGR